MQWLQGALGDFGALLGNIFSGFGEEIVLIAFLGFMYWCIDKESGRFMGLATCIGIVSNPMVKNVFLRRRPYFDNPGIKCLKPVDASADLYDVSAQGFSFPSCHSSNAVIAYGGLAVCKKKTIFRVIGIVLPLLVGLARIEVGVHYPTDVLVGLGFGIVILALLSFVCKKVSKRWVIYLVVFLLSCIGIFYCRSNDYFASLGIMGGFFAGDLIEEKFVKFENTNKPLKWLIRILGGFALYYGLNTLFKLPFSAEFRESATMAAYMVRFARYFMVTFIIFAVYPILFVKAKKLF